MTEAPKSWEIFKIFGDLKTHKLFMDISEHQQPSTHGLSTRQFYDRLSILKRYDLVYKVNGRYELSTFGTTILPELKSMDKIIENYRSFSIIDLILKQPDIPMNEKIDILQRLVDIDLLKRVSVGLVNQHRPRAFPGMTL